MSGNEQRGKSLAKAAIAKTNVTSLTVESVYEDSRQRFQALSQDLGVTYSVNNNVLSNQTNADIDALQLDTHVHSNKVILDAITASFTSALKTAYDGYEARIADLELRLAGYETHTHSYLDGTIADTGDGTGTQTDTSRSTGVVE